MIPSPAAAFRSVSARVADSGDVDTLFTYPDSAYYLDLRAGGSFTAAYPPMEAYLFGKFFGRRLCCDAPAPASGRIRAPGPCREAP